MPRLNTAHEQITDKDILELDDSSVNACSSPDTAGTPIEVTLNQPCAQIIENPSYLNAAAERLNFIRQEVATRPGDPLLQEELLRLELLLHS